ncbi:MAG: glycosyltransferase family 39 protein [Planctomycetales bacterium]|nr:glycosyltransferase family 39 protein [Planctomycetales bacterium]
MGVSFDESFCQRMVEFSWGEMVDRISLDTHPPLFYFILKTWGYIFGGSVFAGRCLTAIFGTLSVAGMYAFVRAAYGEAQASSQKEPLKVELSALVAAALVAIGPLEIFWTLQIRMYSLSFAIGIWSAFFLVRALKSKQNHVSDWLPYTLSVSLLIHTHSFGLFLVAGQFIYALAERWQNSWGTLAERLKPVVLSALAVWFSFQAWLPYFLEQRDRVESNFYLPEPSLEVFGRAIHELFTGMGAQYTAVTGLAVTQASVLVLLGLAIGRRPADYLIVVSTSLPVIAAVVISWLSRPIVAARYFMLSHMFFLAAVAVLVCRLPRLCRFIAIPMLLILAFIPCRDQSRWRAEAAKLPGIQTAVSKLAEMRRDQPLVVCNPMLYTSVLTYVEDRANVYSFLPRHGYPFYQGTPVMKDKDYVNSAWLNASSHQNIWTLDADDSMGRVPLSGDWKLLGEERYQEWFANLIIRRYSRINAE